MSTIRNEFAKFGEKIHFWKKREEGNSTVEPGVAPFVGEEATTYACGPSMPKDKDSEKLMTDVDSVMQCVLIEKKKLHLEEERLRNVEDHLSYYALTGLNLPEYVNKFKVNFKVLQSRLKSGEAALKAEKALLRDQTIKRKLALLYSQDEGIQNMYKTIEYQKECIKTEKEKLTIEEERLREMVSCSHICLAKGVNPLESNWLTTIGNKEELSKRQTEGENAVKTEKGNMKNHISAILSLQKPSAKNLSVTSHQAEGEGSAVHSQEEEELSPVIFQGYSNSSTFIHKDFGVFFSKYDQELKKKRIRPLKVLFVYFCTRIENDIDNAFKSKDETFDLLVVMQEERMKQEISTYLSQLSLMAITLLYSNDKILDNEDNIRAIKEVSSYFQSHHHNFKSEQ